MAATTRRRRKSTRPSADLDVLTDAPTSAHASEPIDAVDAPIEAPGSPVPSVEVVCPTLNRPEGLERLRASLPSDVIFTPSIEVRPRALTTCVNKLVARAAGDIVMVLADHIELQPGCVDAIRRAFDEHPEAELVGLHMENLPPKPGVREYCFMAMTQAFINRFPERRVYCPDYYHFFGDTELGTFALDAGLFYFAEDARIITHSANNGQPIRDETFRAGRINLNRDTARWEDRQKRGWLWGKNFDVIGGEFG